MASTDERRGFDLFEAAVSYRLKFLHVFFVHLKVNGQNKIVSIAFVNEFLFLKELSSFFTFII